MADLLIVLAFVLYAVSTGLRARKRASQNLSEYFLAGKTLTGWRAGVSMAATQFAADTPLLVTGLIATGGIFLVWRLWIYGLAFLLMGFVFAAGWRRAGVVTDAELAELRYSGPGVLALRGLKALYYGTVINCVVIAMVLVAALRIAEVFLVWHAWLPTGLYASLSPAIQALGISLASGATGLDPSIATTNNLISIIALVSFTAFYSTAGGLRSVVATDFVQFFLAMAGTLIYACVVIAHIGGLEELPKQLAVHYGREAAEAMLSFTPSQGEVLMPFLILISLQWFFQASSDGSGYLAQRAMACRTDREARIAGLVFAWLQIVVRSLLWLVIGIGLLVIYPFNPADLIDFTNGGGEQFTASRELVFVTGINDLLPSGVRGVMLVGLLAALASTIDTHMNWGASYWSNDLYKRLLCQAWLQREPQNKELVFVARVSNIIVLGIALIIMTQLGSIQAAWSVSLLFGAGTGAVLVVRWLWERINVFSEIAAMLVSLIAAPILLMTIDAEWLRIAIMGGLSTLAAIGITFFSPATERAVLDHFYQRVQPLGFWRDTALRAGDNPHMPLQRFFRELKSTILCAGSLFLTLIGFGKLLVHSVNESSLWAWIALGLAAMLVPFWWRTVAASPRRGIDAGTDEKRMCG